MDQKSLTNNILKWLIISIAGFVVVLFVFGAGIFIGGIKAKFSYKWADNYHNNFAGPKGGFGGEWRKQIPVPRDFISGHGVFGEVIKNEDSEIVIKGQDEVEKAVVVDEKTLVEEGRKKIAKEDLEVGDFVTVIGSPDDDGKIEAKMIRVFNR